MSGAGLPETRTRRLRKSKQPLRAGLRFRLALSFLPIIRFWDKRRGILAGLSMFVLGAVLELGQHFSPGRAVELGDVLANGAGVSCGTLLGLPFRTLIALI